MKLAVWALGAFLLASSFAVFAVNTLTVVKVHQNHLSDQQAWKLLDSGDWTTPKERFK